VLVRALQAEENVAATWDGNWIFEQLAKL